MNHNFLHVKSEPEEKKRWRTAANFHGKTLSSWVRDTLKNQAEKDIKEFIDQVKNRETA